MKTLLTLAALSLFAVSCNNANNTDMENRSDSDIQRMETPASESQGTSTSPGDIQREEDVSSGSLNTGTSDVEMSEDSATGAGSTGSDIGTNRGAGSAAGSSDAAGMGMDE